MSCKVRMKRLLGWFAMLSVLIGLLAGCGAPAGEAAATSLDSLPKPALHFSAAEAKSLPDAG